MATKYKVSVKIECWKRHLCIACGSSFRYVFRRNLSGQGATEAGAQKSAQKLSEKALAQGVDEHPCPSCGTIQPEMTGTRCRKFHAGVLIVGMILLAVLMGLSGGEVLDLTLMGKIGSGVMAGLVVTNALAAVRDPNHDLERNKERAARSVESGILILDGRPAGVPRLEAVPKASGFGQGSAFLSGILAILAVFAAELLRISNGWPANEGWFPPVMGAGDESKIYFPHKVTSLKSHWRATATATVLNAQELGLKSDQIPARSKQDFWGSFISTKSSEKNSRSSVWVRITLPESDALEGKALDLKIDAVATFPTMSAGNTFEERQETFETRSSVKVVAAGAASSYTKTFWGGMAAGLALFILSSGRLIALASALKKQGNPYVALPMALPSPPASPPPLPTA
jgi:hypothetical protein